MTKRLCIMTLPELRVHYIGYVEEEVEGKVFEELLTKTHIRIEGAMVVQIGLDAAKRSMMTLLPQFPNHGNEYTRDTFIERKPSDHIIGYYANKRDASLYADAAMGITEPLLSIPGKVN